MKQYLKPTLIIIGVILLATAISKTINSSESLTEYAERKQSSQTTESISSAENETQNVDETATGSTETTSEADIEITKKSL